MSTEERNTSITARVDARQEPSPEEWFDLGARTGQLTSEHFHAVFELYLELSQGRTKPLTAEDYALIESEISRLGRKGRPHGA